jgi:flavin-dependent dehydrogenase
VTGAADGTLPVPGTRKGLEHDMFDTITVIGAGRAGTTIAARLRERGIRGDAAGDLRLDGVADRAIAEVARSIDTLDMHRHVNVAREQTGLAAVGRRVWVNG